MRAVEAFAALVLDADRAAAVVEQHPRGERVQLGSSAGPDAAWRTSSTRSREPTRR